MTVMITELDAVTPKLCVRLDPVSWLNHSRFFGRVKGEIEKKEKHKSMLLSTMVRLLRNIETQMLANVDGITCASTCNVRPGVKLMIEVEAKALSIICHGGSQLFARK